MRIAEHDDITAFTLRNSAELTRELRLSAAADLEAGRRVGLFYEREGFRQSIANLKPAKSGAIVLTCEHNRQTFDDAREAIKAAVEYCHRMIDRNNETSLFEQH